MHKQVTGSVALAFLLAAIFGIPAWSQGPSALKSRTSAPKDADIDANVSIASLLAQREQSAWSSNKAGTLEGHVVQVEKDPDGDVVMFLAAKPGETGTNNWVIAEVPPAWQKADAALSEKHCRRLLGKHVKVTGWLFYDTHPMEDPRGTPWELHPVTRIAVMD
jgi:hypothetical protein